MPYVVMKRHDGRVVIVDKNLGQHSTKEQDESYAAAILPVNGLHTLEEQMIAGEIVAKYYNALYEAKTTAMRAVRI